MASLWRLGSIVRSGDLTVKWLKAAQEKMGIPQVSFQSTDQRLLRDKDRRDVNWDMKNHYL